MRSRLVDFISNLSLIVDGKAVDVVLMTLAMRYSRLGTIPVHATHAMTMDPSAMWTENAEGMRIPAKDVRLWFITHDRGI